MSWAATARKWSAHVNELRELGLTDTEKYRITVECYLMASAAYHRELESSLIPSYPVRVSDVGLTQVRNAAATTDVQPKPPQHAAPTPPLSQRSRKVKRALPWTTEIPSPSMEREHWELFSSTTGPGPERTEESERVMEGAAALHEWQGRRQEIYKFPSLWEGEGAWDGRNTACGYGDRHSRRYCQRCGRTFRKDPADSNRCATCFAPRAESQRIIADEIDVRVR